jgi:heterodisulfide reductase subunit A-like polyferredoxin
MSDKKCPLLDELEVIKNHPVKNHTIMIDDIRCCGTDYFDFITKEQLENKIKEINPKYVITYEDSWEPKDILVARLS